jgi:hypothetical protein
MQGLKIGFIRPERHATEVMEEGGWLVFKIGPIRPHRNNAEDKIRGVGWTFK